MQGERTRDPGGRAAPPRQERPTPAEPWPPRDRRHALPPSLARVRIIAAGAALTLVAGLGAAAAGPGRPPAVRKASGIAALSDTDRRAVVALLATRSRAVRDHDRAGFLATSATAPEVFRRSQGQLFDNLRMLPLESWREELAEEAPVRTRTAALTFRVTLRYRLRGLDIAPAARVRYLTFAPDGLRRGANGQRPWTLTGDGGAQGLTDDAEIWDGGRLTVVRGEHGMVIGNSGEPGGPWGRAPGWASAATLREIGRRIDQAAPLVSRTVGMGWRGRAVALVPASSGHAEALAGPGQNLRDIAALATSVASQDGTGRGADRIVISVGSWDRLNALGRRVVLTHELTHVATGGAADQRTPIWLIEGLADYVGYKGLGVSARSAARELRREVAAGRLPKRLPARQAFGGGSGRLSQAYEEAWLACRMVADRYGEATLLRLYRTAGRTKEAAALREVLGVSVGGFTAMWRDYLRKELA